MANFLWPEQIPPSAPSWSQATRQGLLAVGTVAPHRTRTRPSLPSFLHKNGPGSSGTLPTSGLLELVLHHRPDDTSWRLPNLLTKRWGAPRRYTGSRQTNLPPWSGRAGAPGEDQFRPTLPHPRRIRRFYHPVTTIGMKFNISPKIRQLFTRVRDPIFVFNPSISHFIPHFSCSLPDNIYTIFPWKALLWQNSAERKKEWKKGRKKKYCCTIPFISFARFRFLVSNDSAYI